MDQAPFYSEKHLRKWLRRMDRACVLNGSGTRVSVTPDGQRIQVELADFVKHPWTITPNYEDSWVAYVEPGFLNGRDVWTFRDGEWSALVDDDSRGLILAGWRDVLRNGGVADSSLETGNLAFTAAEGYPRAFDGMGIKGAAPGGDSTDPVESDAQSREIRACDVALTVPRLASSQQVTIQDPYSDDEAISIATVISDEFVRANKDHPYRLGAFDKYVPEPEPTYLDRLMGTAIESQTDSILLATVWAISPPGYGQDDEPAPEWDLYPQYMDAGFWNLQHATINIPPQTPPKPLVLKTGLAAGIADLIIASILAPINDANEAVVSYLQGSTYAGRFYIT